MNTAERLEQADTGLAPAGEAARLAWFFALAYSFKGVSCAQFGIINQPLQNMMLNGLKLSAAEASAWLSILMIPWIIKPLFGLMSDFLPLMGYRRKSYLIAANLVAAAAFMIMAFSSSFALTIGVLLAAAAAMAVSTVVMVALAVENGGATGAAPSYFSIQEGCYYAANIGASLAAGLLCQHLLPEASLRAAALIAIVPLLVLPAAVMAALKQEHRIGKVVSYETACSSLLSAFKIPQLRLIAFCCFAFSCLLCFGVPLYAFEQNVLHFSQSTIGQLSAINAAGMLVAVVIYPRIGRNLEAKKQLLLASSLICLSTAGYLLLSNFWIALFLELFRGCASMLGVLTLYSLAASVCPRLSEASVMAVLVSLINIGTISATSAGGQLYGNWLGGNFTVLVLTAMILPLASLVLTASARR